MRNNSRVNVIIKQQPVTEKPKGFFERNQGLIQFIAVILTLVALLVTLYYSNQNTQISNAQLLQVNKQLQQSDSQLKLAQEQFTVSLKQRTIDSLNKAKEDSVQDARFKLQNDLNIGNLRALQLQASVAKSQYIGQIDINKEIYYQNRPIFSMLNVTYDSLSNAAIIKIQNVGKRNAKIRSSTVLSWNFRKRVFGQNIVADNKMDLNETISANFSVPVSNDDFSDVSEGYYISFVYQDFGDKSTQTFEKFFSWKIFNGQYVWGDLTEENTRIFEDQMRIHGIKKNISVKPIKK